MFDLPICWTQFIVILQVVYLDNLHNKMISKLRNVQSMQSVQYGRNKIWQNWIKNDRKTLLFLCFLIKFYYPTIIFSIISFHCSFLFPDWYCGKFLIDLIYFLKSYIFTHKYYQLSDEDIVLDCSIVWWYNHCLHCPQNWIIVINCVQVIIFMAKLMAPRIWYIQIFPDELTKIVSIFANSQSY